MIPEVPDWLEPYVEDVTCVLLGINAVACLAYLILFLIGRVYLYFHPPND